MDWLKEESYTHCFYVAGGGSMHLLDSASKRFICIPVVHEVSAAIATEYFNESTNTGKAFCLVTTGPGLTNAITGIAGAWLESHELLVLAGQVKTSDLASGGIRQRGIQELPGTEIVKSITKVALRLDKIVEENEFKRVVRTASEGRKGPVVIEVCIDISASIFQKNEFTSEDLSKDVNLELPHIYPEDKKKFVSLLKLSRRPLILLGGGVDRTAALTFINKLANRNIPIATTWAGADRVPSDYKGYAGRPNTFGMRWANVFQQQTDLLIAVGTRLGLQQTGFNWKEFCPVGKVVLVDIDESEIRKGHPEIELGLATDSSLFLEFLAESIISYTQDISEWLEFLKMVRQELPILEKCHMVGPEYVDPYHFINFVSSISMPNDVFTPGTSGGTHTAFYQTYQNKLNQKIISNKGLASMGYGLAGAIGAAFANPNSRIINFEGDGSFSQNIQELATVSRNKLNIKIFLINNGGYASIRSSQITYFEGNYNGCDVNSGLGFPNWEYLASCFDIKYLKITPENSNSDKFLKMFSDESATLFEIIADPAQLYLPKISSQIMSDGSMVSNPLHIMTPELPEKKKQFMYKFLPQELWGS